MKILPRFAPRNGEYRLAKFSGKLLHRKAVIGGQIFGPIPEGHQREFFSLDKSTWVWYEAWTDQSGQYQSINTRYVVRPDGVFKTQNGGNYQNLSNNEALNLYKATAEYLKRVTADYYMTVQTA